MAVVPSELHEAIVEMLRDKPELVLALLRAAHAQLPPGARAEATSESLSSSIPDYRADCIVEVRDGRARLALIVVVEVQLHTSDKKLFALPVYQALARARHAVPCEVVVIAPRPRVAEWARRPVELGGGSVFHATVIGADELSLGDPPLLAARSPELGFLRAIAGGDRDPTLVLEAAAALDALPESRAELYFDLILSAL